MTTTRQKARREYSSSAESHSGSLARVSASGAVRSACVLLTLSLSSSEIWARRSLSSSTLSLSSTASLRLCNDVPRQKSSEGERCALLPQSSFMLCFGVLLCGRRIGLDLRCDLNQGSKVSCRLVKLSRFDWVLHFESKERTWRAMSSSCLNSTISLPSEPR